MLLVLVLILYTCHHVSTASRFIGILLSLYSPQALLLASFLIPFLRNSLIVIDD